jgi:hypothetical protein
MDTVNDYRIVVSGSDYVAPEARRFHLQGEVGEYKLTSSPIVSVEGNEVRTRSGSLYILGSRAEGYETFEEVRKRHPYVPMN